MADCISPPVGTVAGPFEGTLVGTLEATLATLATLAKWSKSPAAMAFSPSLSLDGDNAPSVSDEGQLSGTLSLDLFLRTAPPNDARASADESSLSSLDASLAAAADAAVSDEWVSDA
mmetsp:Transcript_42251/g.105237  ORF Transcript_42251/g.105237 Transcript_42251/m.105237 type:complete len:117 (+) Transcript_42251:1201-1551(+)